MTRRRRWAPRPPTVRVAASLAGAALLATVSGGFATPARAAPAGADPVRVVVDTFGTRRTTTGDVLQVTGRLLPSASAGATVGGLSVALEAGGALNSRGQLDAQLTDPAATALPVVGSTQVGGSVEAGGRGVRFTIAVPTAAVGLGAAQLAVRPVVVVASGVVGGTGGAVPVGRVGTYVVDAPATIDEPTPVTVVLPLADRPRLRADNVLTDDELAAEIRPGGRLDRLLAAATAPVPRGRSTPVVLAVEPATIEAIELMTRTYYYVTEEGTEQRQPADRYAQAFLARLTAFRGTVVALPYGDVDIAALLHSGQRAVVQRALTTGRTDLAKRLGRTIASGVAVPAGGRLDQAAVDTLTADGIGTFVLDEDALPIAADASYTPSAVAALPTASGVRRALVSDARLTRLVSTSPVAATNPVVVRQNVLADVAMDTADRPGDPRPLVVSLPRYWNPPGSWATTVVSGLAAAPWVRPAGNPAAVAATTPAAAGLRGSLTYPAAARSAELPAAILTPVDRIRTATNGFAGALAAGRCSDGSTTDPAGRTAAQTACDRTPVPGDAAAGEQPTAAIDQGLYRAVSVAWRGQQLEGATYVDGIDQALRAVQGAVQVVASRAVTLTSRTGKVPVTLQNDLSVPIDVRLRLSAGDRARLRSDATVARTVPAKAKVQVEIEVQAESAGTFPVDLTMLAPNGTPLSSGPAQRVLVKSTVYGVIAVGITVGAVAVLFLAAGVRLVRRLRSGRTAHALAPPADRTAA